ncbi:MAG: F510_1955 family glycosylhydrolase [Pseudonocardiaceae bacterium]
MASSPHRTADSRRTSASARSSRGRQQPAPPASGLWMVVAVVLLLVVGTVLFLILRGGDDGASVAEGAELEHVHGLGVDPADGTLYAGSHYGLFRVPERGQAVRIAGRVQDFMGFTVAGPDHFLASGHPGEDQGGPSSLGLIESTDGGQTWHSLSLAGRADFHALEARHGRVYGFNALTGAFMVSQDKQTWQPRSQLPLADFAVSPSEPEVVLATTANGLARSDDGGRTFALVDQAPPLLLVTWTNDGVIVGVDPEGRVYISTDGLDSWQPSGELGGSPEALTATSATDIYAATSGGTIVASTDGGRTFKPRYPAG